jgi:hypothetical protein
MARKKRFVMPAEAGIQQASGSEPKDSFAPAGPKRQRMDGALDSRFRGNDKKKKAAFVSYPIGRA